MISKKWLHRSGRATSAVLALGLCISAAGGLAQSAATTPGKSTASGALPAGSFIAAPSIYLGYASSSVATGDLRSSGKLDLVTANSAAGTVVVFLSQGSGKFSSGVSYATGSQPLAVALADVTGQGHADIVVANGGGNTISVLPGRGDGSFGSPVSYPVGFSPSMLATGDFSGKGTQEVAVASASGTQLAVFSSNGNGGFGTPRLYSLTAAPAGIVAADLNHDGRIDLALANANGTVTSLLNDGTGQFRQLAAIKVSSGALSSIAVADLNHDGIADLAVTESGSRQISVLMGKGDGSFAKAVAYAVGAEPVAAQIADVDGDGNADLIVVNKSSNTFSVLSGAGDGTFKAAQHFVVGNAPAGAVLGDFYGSGHFDLASVNLLSKSVSLPQSNGDGTFHASRSYVTGEQPVAIASADLTGAGHADLAVANYCGSDVSCKEPGSVAILLADSAGVYRLASVYPVGSGPVALALRDINGDGKLDLIALNRGDKTITVRLGEGDGAFGQVLTFPLSGSPVALASGNFAVSGHAGLAVLEDCGEAKCSTAGSVEILAGDGAGNFHSTASFAVGYQPVSISAGALTSKGNTDLVVLNRCGGDASCQSTGTATILRGDGAGNFTAAKPVSVGTNPGSLALGALTSAGTLDLIVSRTGSNSLAVLRGNGDGSFQSAVSYAAGSAPGALLMADFNGDGVPDVAVANASDSTVSVLYGKGDGTLQTATNFPVGAHPSTMTVLNSKGSNLAGIATANGSTSGSAPGSEVTALFKVTAMDTPAPLTSFTVTMASNSINVNQGTLITAMAEGDSTNGAPMGTVTVTATSGSNTVTLCSNVVPGTPSGDTVTYSCAATASAGLAAGSWNITASYTDGTVYGNGGGSPADNPLVVNPIAATLAFTTVPAGPVGINTTSGFIVTLTASRTPVAPAGNVVFSQGSTTLCTSAITLGSTITARCLTSALSGPSPATVTATYTDTNGNFTVATAPTTSVVLTPVSTTLAINVGTTTPTVDTPVRLSAVITATPHSPITPTGTVSFSANGTNISGCSGSSPSSVALAGGSYQAICTTSSLTAGSVSVSAVYTGDNNFVGSNTTTAFSVAKLTPKYTLSAAPASPNASITVNVPVVFTIAFTIPASSAQTQPTGAIAVAQAGTTLCTVILPATTCTYSAGFAAAGPYTMTSSYNGDGQFNSATSANIGITAGATGTMTTVSGPSTASVNTGVAFTATVTSNVVGATVPQGSVAFTVTNSSNSTTTPCTGATLSPAGTAMCSYPFPASGSYTVNATYKPSPANFTTSSSANAQSVTVSASSVSVAVVLDSGSANPSVINQPVKFNSTLTFPTGSAKPNGQGDTIVYYDGANMLCTAAVNATTSPYTPVACTIYTLSLGGHSITAAFVPGASDTNFKAQTSGPITQAVNADPTTLLAVAPLTPPEVNQTYTLLASVTPAYVYGGSGGRSPSGGSVSFTYVNGSSTVNLCTATVGSESKASCSPAAGSLTAGNYTITATYTDSASPANFVTSNAPTPITVVKDTPAVTIGSLPASIQVNQALTLTASIKPHFSGPIVPTGTVAFMSGATTLCTATISSGSATCMAAYADLPTSATAYSISATYTPDTSGGVNFLTASTTTSGSVTVTAATTSVKVSGTPASGYASQTITYTATVSTTPAIPTGGVVPTGTITFANVSAIAFAGTTCPKITIPAGATFPYSASCTVTYPSTYTGNLNTDSITAAYASGDANFVASNNSANPLVEPVQNFSLGFTSSSSSSIFLTQGHDTTNDPYFTGQSVMAVSTSTATTGVGVLKDTLNYTCTVSSGAGVVSDPSCAPAATSAAPGADVSYILKATSAPAGLYTITVTATDPNATALSYTLTKQLNVTSVVTQPIIFAGSVPQTETVNFGSIASGATLSIVGCPRVQFPGESGTKQNPDPSDSNAQYVSCSGSGSAGSASFGVTITPCQTGSTGTSGGSTTSCGGETSAAAVASAKSKAGRSAGGSYIAVALGLPVLAFFGWFGRNRARRNLFRMMTILLLGWGALTVSGCGGGYKVTSPGSSSPATNLAPGSYNILVEATDNSTPANTYYAVVAITVN